MLDELTQKINAGAAEVQRQVAVPHPARIRTRARRVRMRSAITASVSAGVVLIGSGVLVRAALDGAAPAVSVAPSGFVMLHEGEPGWKRDDNATVRAAFSGCGSSDPTLPGRTSAITMTGPGPAMEEQHSPTLMTEQLFFYDSEQAAVAAIAALREAVTACGWIDPRMGEQLSGTNAAGDRLERVSGVQLRHIVFLVHSVTTGARMSSAGEDVYMIGGYLCRTIGVCVPGGSATGGIIPTGVIPSGLTHVPTP